MNQCNHRCRPDIICLFIFCLWFVSCKNYNRNKSYATIPESSIRAGEELAKIHCSSCHEFPEPSLLNVDSWEQGVLPQMGPRLGVFKHNFKYYPSFKSDPNVDSNYYPSKPLVNAKEWQSILDYYLATSPDSMPGQGRSLISNKTLPGFAIQAGPLKIDSPAVSMLKLKQSSSGPELIINDIIRQRLYVMKYDETVYSTTASGNIVDLEFDEKKYIVCDIGQLNPTNAKFGSLSFGLGDTIRYDSSHVFSMSDHLARPVAIAKADLNQDNKNDYVVCEFGNLSGALSWLEDIGGGKYSRHLLSDQAGAIKAHIVDHNKDGLPDIWALFSQGAEGITIFTNLGKGRFHQERVLTFPSVYGSSYFELADFNNDGYQDILYTCGDNADFSMVLKPYHGVYIFMNDGKNNFSQKYFYPIHGCFKAMARDFDKDGDLDIASISFFPDFAAQPEEGFVYLQNQGEINENSFKFEPFTFPESEEGRWLTMDVGDLDADGKPDIVLGNFSIRPSETKPGKDWKKGPPYLILRNIK